MKEIKLKYDYFRVINETIEIRNISSISRALRIIIRTFSYKNILSLTIGCTIFIIFSHQFLKEVNNYFLISIIIGHFIFKLTEAATAFKNQNIEIKTINKIEINNNAIIIYYNNHKREIDIDDKQITETDKNFLLEIAKLKYTENKSKRNPNPILLTIAVILFTITSIVCISTKITNEIIIMLICLNLFLIIIHLCHYYKSRK